MQLKSMLLGAKTAYRIIRALNKRRKKKLRQKLAARHEALLKEYRECDALYDEERANFRK